MSNPLFWEVVGIKRWSPFFRFGIRSAIFWHFSFDFHQFYPFGPNSPSPIIHLTLPSFGLQVINKQVIRRAGPAVLYMLQSPKGDLADPLICLQIKSAHIIPAPKILQGGNILSPPLSHLITLFCRRACKMRGGNALGEK